MALPVTIVIPVKNESLNLPACLASIGSDFYQVVVVDSGSTDDTREIAAKSGAVVLEFKWDGRFPKKRNWVLRNYQFETPWVRFLDADERLTTGFISELRARLPQTTNVGFWIRFNNWFLDRPLRHGDQFRKLALFKVGCGEFERFPEDNWCHLDMEVHEHPILTGAIGVINAPLEHRDFKDLTHYRAKHIAYAKWEAMRFKWLHSADSDAWALLNRRQRFKYRFLHRWWLSWVYFATSFIAKRGFFDGLVGLQFGLEKQRYFSKIRYFIKLDHDNKSKQ